VDNNYEVQTSLEIHAVRLKLASCDKVKNILVCE
jgi:hypothetical protein